MGRRFTDLTEARQYTCAVVAASIEDDLHDPDGWVFGGVEDEEDKRLVRTAAREVRRGLLKRAGHPVAKKGTT